MASSDKERLIFRRLRDGVSREVTGRRPIKEREIPWFWLEKAQGKFTLIEGEMGRYGKRIPEDMEVWEFVVRMARGLVQQVSGPDATVVIRSVEYDPHYSEFIPIETRANGKRCGALIHVGQKNDRGPNGLPSYLHFGSTIGGTQIDSTEFFKYDGISGITVISDRTREAIRDLDLMDQLV